MLTIQTQVHVSNITGAEMIDFMLHCTDREYQAWWQGTHLEFHTIKRYPDNIGNIVYMDEFVGKKRVKMLAIVTEVIPGRRIVWQMKQIVRLPVWLIIDFVDDPRGVRLTHSLQAGFKGLGRILDPIWRIYFTDEFRQSMDEHATIEFPKLGEMLRTQIPNTSPA
ncbi:hypothetical protein TFLX_00146 [Thermoflexales bacterium]|nr:hypothetical protein TFLX_00146 [Thermoflexales bacterium]